MVLCGRPDQLGTREAVSDYIRCLSCEVAERSRDLLRQHQRAAQSMSVSWHLGLFNPHPTLAIVSLFSWHPLCLSNPHPTLDMKLQFS